MTVNVTTYKMPDSMPSQVAKQSVETIKEVLEEHDCEGDFLATAKGRFHSRSFPRFKFVRFENGQLICKLRPGGNDTAWEWWVTPPTGASGDRIASRLRGEPSDEELLSAAVPAEFDPDKVAAALAAEEPAEDAPVADVISAKYTKAEKRSEAYAARLAALEELRTELQATKAQVTSLEKQIKDAETALGRDVDGKTAYETVIRIKQLLGMED
jgi:hypothetical protein